MSQSRKDDQFHFVPKEILFLLFGELKDGKRSRELRKLRLVNKAFYSVVDLYFQKEITTVADCLKFMSQQYINTTPLAIKPERIARLRTFISYYSKYGYPELLGALSQQSASKDDRELWLYLFSEGAKLTLSPNTHYRKMVRNIFRIVLTLLNDKTPTENYRNNLLQLFRNLGKQFIDACEIDRYVSRKSNEYIAQTLLFLSQNLIQFISDKDNESNRLTYLDLANDSIKKILNTGTVFYTEDVLMDILKFTIDLQLNNQRYLLDLSTKRPAENYQNILKNAHLYPIILDFGDGDLTNVSLRNAYLEGAQFCYSNLKTADLQGTNLTNARFASAKLEGTILTQAVLYKTSFPYAYINDVDLQGVNFKACDFTRTTIKNVTIDASTFDADCLLNRVEFGPLKFAPSMGLKYLTYKQLLMFSSLTNTELQSQDLTQINFFYKNLSGCKFLNCDLAYANFNQSNLTDVCFNHSNLLEVQFTDATLDGVHLTHVYNLSVNDLIEARSLRNISIDCATLNANKVSKVELALLKKKMIASHQAYLTTFTNETLEDNFGTLLKELTTIILAPTHTLKILNNPAFHFEGFKNYGLTDAYATVINSGRKKIVTYLSNLEKEKLIGSMRQMIEKNYQNLWTLFSAQVSPLNLLNGEQRRQEKEMLNWFKDITNCLVQGFSFKNKSRKI